MSGMQYEERYVAFLDILNFRKLVEDETKTELLYNKLDAANRFPDVVKVAQNRGYDLVRKFHILESTVISDSIVVSVSAYEPDGLKLLMQHVAALWEAFISDQIMLRGAITRGKAIHKNKIVLGPAVVRAYSLESVACYARVIIDDVLMSSDKEYLESSNVLKDLDGQWVFSIVAEMLLQGTSKNGPEHAESLVKLYKFVINQEKEVIGKPYIYKKYVQLHRHLNLAMIGLKDNEKVILEPKILVKVPELPDGCIARYECKGCQFYTGEKRDCEKRSKST